MMTAHLTRERGLFFLVVLALLISVMPVIAQDDDDDESDIATYTWRSGALTFEHPAAWVVVDETAQYGAVTIATSEDIVNAQVLGPDDLLMQITAPISTIQAAQTRYGLPINEPADALSILAVPTDDEPVTFDLDGRDAARLDVDLGDIRITLVLVETEGRIQYLFAATGAESIAPFEEAVLDIAASLREAEIPEGGGIVQTFDTAPQELDVERVVDESLVWRQVGAFDDPTQTPFRILTPALFGRLEVGADDQIYVATGGDSILVFDPDGTLNRIISNGNVVVGDIALDPDGSFWVADPIQNKVFHLDAEGNVIGGFGQYGSGPDQFGITAPADMVIGPDELLYVLSTNTAEGNTYEEIQVWRKDGTFVRSTIVADSTASPERSLLSLGLDENLYITYSGGPLVTIRTLDDVTLIDLPGPEDALLPTALYARRPSVFFVAYNGTVGLFDGASDEPVQTYGVRTRNAASLPAPGEVLAPHGIGVMSDGDVIIADATTAGWQVMRFDSDPLLLSPELLPEATPESTAEPAPDGDGE